MRTLCNWKKKPNFTFIQNSVGYRIVLMKSKKVLKAFDSYAVFYFVGLRINYIRIALSFMPHIV